MTRCGCGQAALASALHGTDFAWVAQGLFGQATLNMFSMNKLLGKHLFRREDLVVPAEESDEEEEDGEQPAAKKAKTDKPKPKAKAKPKAEAAPRPRPAPSAAAVFDPFDPYARAAKKAAKAPRPAKDPNAPKGALTPYFLFTQEERPRLLAAQPGLGFAALGKKLGERWRALDDGERQRFEALAVADRQRAAAELAAYKPPAPGRLAAAATQQAAARQAGARTQRQKVLAPPLAALLGVAADAPTLTRPEAVARMFAYFSDHALLDPADKRYVLADAPLRQVFGKERFKAFAVNALLSPMLSRPEGASDADASDADEGSSDSDEEKDLEAEEAAADGRTLPGEKATEMADE